jgi:hypothetical protein
MTRRRNNNKRSKKIVKQKSKAFIAKISEVNTIKNESEKLKKSESNRLVKQELEREDVIQAMAKFIYNCIQQYERLKPRHYGVSCFPGPRIFNSTDPNVQPPEVSDIKDFIQAIFDKRRLQVESGIIALVLLMRTGIKINSLNWMRLILISLLLANKQSEDVYSVWNAKFVGLIPNVENLEINILELEFLQYLKYKLHIETSTYQQYYTKLQNLTPLEEEEEVEMEISVKADDDSLENPSSEKSVEEMSDVEVLLDKLEMSNKDVEYEGIEGYSPGGVSSPTMESIA